MDLYKLNRMLRNKGFSLVKQYKTMEIWTNGKKDLTIPINCDTVHNSIVKDLLAKINS